MSSFSSYEEKYLNKKLVALEKEMLALKTAQRYGSNQARTYTSNSVSLASTLYSSEYGMYSRYTAIAHLKFVGSKPSKVVVGDLQYATSGVSSTAYGYPQVMATYPSTDNEKNVIHFWFCYGTMDSVDSSWSARVWVVSNDTGVLTLVESYPVSSNTWVLGQ